MAASGKQQLQQIDLSQLAIPQLNQLSQQLEQEIDLFASSMSQLKLAQGKFVESQESLEIVNKDNLNTDILVPLTSSMYVPGQLSDVQNVLIDIGTGYYIETSVEDGKTYFKRKIEFVTKQMERVQPLLHEKYRMKQMTMEILQMKIQGQLAQQQPPGTVKA